jgi:Mlc titration factor MtfA (ptsG expression regulator)
MKLFILLILVGFSVWAGFFINAFRRKQKRRMLLSTPFPPAWDDILKKNLPPYGKLSSQLRQQLHDATRIFIAEKSFEGCGGLTLTDEVKVTIAAQACMLLLNRKMEYYPRLYSILVYPSTYVAGTRHTIRGQPNETSVRLGESWHAGAVVLAWDSVKHGAANFNDGHNVTMHEFAHQLDQHYSAAAGAPLLASRSAYSAWAMVFSKEYEDLRRKTAKGRESVMDAYGATNPAEFFAVVTETFFEKPSQLKSKHPDLYEELYSFYRVNPIEWE